MRALSSRPFCPCDSRRVSLWYLSAGLRYTAEHRDSLHIGPTAGKWRPERIQGGSACGQALLSLSLFDPVNTD